MKEKSFSERHIERLDRKCRISLHEISKDHHYPLHWHEYFELEILLSGEGEHRFNGVCRSVREGDVWLMSLCDFHTYVPHSEGAILNVAFAKGFLDRECEELFEMGAACARLSEEEWSEARILCHALLKEAENDDPLAWISRRSLISRLIVLLLRRGDGSVPGASVSSIHAAIVYLHAHYRESISIEDVAFSQGLSPNYFGNLFRRVTSTGFCDYLNKLRLKHACDLLTSSELPIKEIALQSGYSSVEYFFGVFKKKLGMPPARYRKEQRGRADAALT